MCVSVCVCVCFMAHLLPSFMKVDAPCMLRKGLPRAFPGLDEVKSESVKEGTQYRSRVFQAPPNLVQGKTSCDHSVLSCDVVVYVFRGAVICE